VVVRLVRLTLSVSGLALAWDYLTLFLEQAVRMAESSGRLVQPENGGIKSTTISDTQTQRPA